MDDGLASRLTSRYHGRCPRFNSFDAGLWCVRAACGAFGLAKRTAMVSNAPQARGGVFAGSLENVAGLSVESQARPQHHGDGSRWGSLHRSDIATGAEENPDPR